jgi:hypothetical protein
MNYDESTTEVGERRSSTRQETDSRVRVAIETSEFGGQAENISPAGVFFFSADAVRVRVELESRTGTRRYFTGRLVRVQRMSEDETGFAIEFDRV